MFKADIFYQCKSMINLRSLNIFLILVCYFMMSFAYSSEIESLKKIKDHNEMADLFSKKGDYIQAEHHLELALITGEAIFGKDSPQLLNSLVGLANIYRRNKDFEKVKKAESLYQRALSILANNQSNENDQMSYAQVLQGLASVYDQLGRYEEAYPLYLQVQQIYLLGKRDNGLEFAIFKSLLAQHFYEIGNYNQAINLEQEALQIKERVEESANRDYDLRVTRQEIAHSLNHLAILFQDKGDFVQAEKFHRSALKKIIEAVGEEHLSVAQDLDNLAGFYFEKGDISQAIELRAEANRMAEKILGPNDYQLAPFLVNQADLFREIGKHYRTSGNLDEAKDYFNIAENLLLRALAIRESSYGVGHSQSIATISALAVLYREKGDFVKAEKFYLQALKISKKTFGAESVKTALILNNLGIHYRNKGDFLRAVENLEKSVEIQKKAFGDKSWSVGESIFALAVAVWGAGDLTKAAELNKEANTIKGEFVRHTLIMGTEKQKRLYTDYLKGQSAISFSLLSEIAPKNPEYAGFAMTLALQNKGQVLDVMSENVAALRRRAQPEDLTLLDELLKIKSKVAFLEEKNLDEEATQQLLHLRQKEAELESELSERNLQYRLQSKLVTFKEIQQNLPPQTALVEFIEYYPFVPKDQSTLLKDEKYKYVALVLLSEGDPQWIEIGDERNKKINSLIKKFRESINPSIAEEDIKKTARELDKIIMQPIRSKLDKSNVQRILLAPDGNLNLIPFGALVNEKNQYLIESYDINYLTSGRDLIRLKISDKSRQEDVVIANPDFNLRGINPERRLWNAVPLTENQADFLKKLLPKVKVRVEDEATKGELLNLTAPRILHIATHGFFNEESKLSSGTIVNDPMLRSGLVLAGANGSSVENDNGLLFAHEVSGLDLWGTKLVFLSACETAIGEIHSGESVYGLRRAFVLAGAESQIMSLWNIKGLEASEIVESYYKKLTKGMGRSEALTNIQRNMIKNNKHPYSWAAFVPLGAWSPMSISIN